MDSMADPLASNQDCPQDDAVAVFTTVVTEPTSLDPNYTCICCMTRFFKEFEVIRHHTKTHLSSIPLRYTCLKPHHIEETIAPCSVSPPKPALVVMEIRFSCPLCPRYFVSLAEAKAHVAEHDGTLWKCGSCGKLTSSSAEAAQHLGVAHSDSSEKVTSEAVNCSSANIKQQLFKSISIIRVQLNNRSFL